MKKLARIGFVFCMMSLFTGSAQAFTVDFLNATSTSLSSYILGNFGIGTTSPMTALTIQPAAIAGASIGTGMLTLAGAHNTVQRPLIYLRNTTAGTTYTGGMRWYDGNNNEGWGIENNRIVGNGNLEFNIAGSNKVVFDSTGNVGIGLTSPTSRLHISDTSSGNRLDVLRLSNPGSGDNTAAAIAFTYSDTSISPAYISAPYIFGQNGAVLQFATSNGVTNGTVRMTIDGFGYVGIGTSSPQTKLDVNGLVRVYQTATTTCSSSIEGSLFYNSGNKHFWGCDGTNWNRLDN